MKCNIAVTFNAAKRLRYFKGPCQQVHGYHHRLEVSVRGDEKADMVVDFYALKQALQNWIDTHWDHTILLHQEDKTLGEAIAAYTGQTVFYMTADPTCETLARHIKEQVMPELLPDAIVDSVRLYDQADAWVEL